MYINFTCAVLSADGRTAEVIVPGIVQSWNDLSGYRKFEELMATLSEDCIVAVHTTVYGCDNWHLFIHGGEICEKLSRYDDAEIYYKIAGEIGTYFCDELDALANLYNKTGKYDNASECYLKMSEIYYSRGFDVEAEKMKLLAKEASQRQKAE